MSIAVALKHSYGSFKLQAELSIAPGILAILGPSGSGKTRLLRALAGLDRIQGQINTGPHDLNQLPPHKRGFAYVGQRSALLPHLSVDANLAFARRRGPQAYGDAQSAELYDELELHELLSRAPHQLSGGEQQRVALAQAMIGGSQVILLDEPTTSLDDQAQDKFLSYLPRLRAHKQLSIIMVTHRLWEAARIADRAALMRAGTLGTSGTINAILTQDELATRIHALSCLDLPVSHYDAVDQLMNLRCGKNSLQIPRADGPVPKQLRILIPADSVSLSRHDAPAGDSSALNKLDVELLRLLPAGAGQACAVLATPAGDILARITTKSIRNLALEPGAKLVAHIKATALQ